MSRFSSSLRVRLWARSDYGPLGREVYATGNRYAIVAPQPETQNGRLSHPNYPMPQNIEVKAKLRDPAAQRLLAAGFADGPSTRFAQDDTFYRSPMGRLKLRRQDNQAPELIFYARPDCAEVRLSTYEVCRIADADALHRVLERSLGVWARVIKERELFMVRQSRIHFDHVVGLGHFLEIEVVLRPGQDHGHGKAIADELLNQLQVAPQDLCSVAYADMLAGSTPA